MAFYPPITWKVMNMCACDTPKPPMPPGEMVMIRSRPCACDPSYGDTSAQYATRQLPRWGMPAFVPSFRPLRKDSKGKNPDPRTASQLPSFNPAVQKTIPFRKTYADKNSWRMPTTSFVERVEQSKYDPFAITVNRDLIPEPTVTPISQQGLGHASNVQLFTPKSNLNSKFQIGTESLPFNRSPHYPWVNRPPYVRFGAGVYDVSNEFRNPGLFGYQLGEQNKDFLAKQLVYSLPLSAIGLSAGLIYGLKKGSLLEGIIYGGIGGILPVGYAAYSLNKEL